MIRPLVACTILAVASLAAQPREHALWVSVLDRTDAPVTDVQASEFIVREDGVRREVLRASRATEPMHIALVVDTTQASSAFTADFRAAVKAFVAAMADEHQIAIVGIADRPTILTDYTRDAKALDRGVGLMFSHPDSGSYFLDTLRELTRGFAKREAARPVIVVVMTEGIELSNVSYEHALDELRASGASLHVIALSAVRANALIEEVRNRSVVWDRGTKATGGRFEQVLAAQALPGVLKQVAAELRNQYRVVYARPESLIQPEKLEVTVTRPGLTARGIAVKEPKP